MKPITVSVDVNAHINNITCSVTKTNNQAIAEISFENLGFGDITAIKFNAIGYNSFGDIVKVNEKDQFFLIVQDVLIKKNTNAEGIIAALPNNEIRRICLEESQICFSDGSIMSYEGKAEKIFETETYDEALTNEVEIIAAVQEFVSPDIKHLPQNSENGWLCGCGRYNSNEQPICSGCGVSKELVFQITNHEFIETIKEKRRIKVAETLEKEKKEAEKKKKEKRNRSIIIGVTIIVLSALIGLGIHASVLSMRSTFSSEGDMKYSVQGTYTYYDDSYKGTEQIVISGDKATYKWRTGHSMDTNIKKWDYRNGVIKNFQTIVVTKNGNLKADGKIFQKGGSLTPFNYSYNSYNSYNDDDDEYDDDDFNSYESGYSVLDITIDRVYNDYNYTICTGSVKNTGSKTYKYVEVKGAFKDSNGEVIDTDWTYAAGSEGLEPGESSTFRLSVTKNNAIASCSVSILDFN